MLNFDIFRNTCTNKINKNIKLKISCFSCLVIASIVGTSCCPLFDGFPFTISSALYVAVFTCILLVIEFLIIGYSCWKKIKGKNVNMIDLPLNFIIF